MSESQRFGKTVDLTPIKAKLWRTSIFAMASKSNHKAMPMGERSEFQFHRHGNNASIRPADPLALIEGSVGEREFVCDQLESIADDLPNRIDVRRALSAMQFLRIKLPVYHSDERRCLFPLLKQRAPHSSGIVPIIAQLQSHQIEDEDFAHEVAEFLEDLSTEPVIRNPDASGYLLRGFFQSYRRYLGWQKLMVLPLANRVLSREDLDHLFAAINFNRKSAPDHGRLFSNSRLGP